MNSRKGGCEGGQWRNDEGIIGYSARGEQTRNGKLHLHFHLYDRRRVTELGWFFQHTSGRCRYQLLMHRRRQARSMSMYMKALHSVFELSEAIEF